eukprot:1030607-Alexandrium_andersonii.AAC.1
MAITADYRNHTHQTHAALRFRPALKFQPSQYMGSDDAWVKTFLWPLRGPPWTPRLAPPARAASPG